MYRNTDDDVSDDVEMTMGVMVKMHNGDVERFDAATQYGQMADGYLELADANGHRVALFAPGWAAAFEAPAKKQYPTVTTASPNLHLHVDDQEMRKVAAAETSKALDALGDSISKQAG